jgi:WhiB family redox-sensing transcriptional regulator
MEGRRRGSAGSRRWNWRAAARCRTDDAEGLFVVGARQRDARRLCRGCAVRTECLAHALDHRIEFGVWGGMTERERRALLRNRPDVRSWTDLLAEARTAHYASAADETAERLAIVSEQTEVAGPGLGESA